MSVPDAPASVLGKGWTHLSSFDDLDDDEYEPEEEVYVTLDLGTTFDSKSLQAESQYQLIGLDTPTPFLKLGNQVFKGDITPLIGDQIICGLIRNHDDPHNPTHPPLFSTNHRITFQPGTLRPKDQSIPGATSGHDLSISEQAKGQETEQGVQVGMSGISRGGSVSVSGAVSGAGAGGPSTLFAGATARPGAGGKRGNKTRRVIEHPDELNTFDLDAMGPHQSVELGPHVMESLGLAHSSDGQGVLLTKKEMENVLLGVPVTGKKGRPKKPHYLGED
ncbi:uncharacterized protein IAS62_006343 [Cryptococcus decagattii]|uniref:Transcription factor TFIIIC triple barrel domain-containing protein n=1 Tax=Cryptococcus decagattii TaxID=1859122 RepID=A0ABZ2B688_9TREE